ncbi:class II aldolase/adducin family protein [Vannielia sp.]|uniref:class II aldolase/adducin family protein n=1 Tax=Vannielia sp. TaxID=2813045 RepID=UPI002619BD55|nr:class II aldolase/adducin family protein [Vannielia sp.]MDF1873872.1 class II aldolase/adducin family protein [Vannielia sp.]
MQKALFSSLPSISHWPTRVDLAAACHWAVNHGATDPGGFAGVITIEGGVLATPPAIPLASVTATTLLETPDQADLLLAALAPLVASPCLLFARTPNSTALAALAESQLPPICADSALFHRKHVIDPNFGGRSPADEATRLSALLAAPGCLIAVIGNLGLLALGNSVAEAVRHLHLFERAAGTYLSALATGRALRIIPEDIIGTRTMPHAEPILAPYRPVEGAGRD